MQIDTKATELGIQIIGFESEDGGFIRERALTQLKRLCAKKRRSRKYTTRARSGNLPGDHVTKARLLARNEA